MSMTKFLFVPILLASIALVGCDKAELEATKQQLQTVSLERDNLKQQLDASKQQNAALTLQVSNLQTKLVAAATALAAPDKAEKADKKGGAGGKTGSAKSSEPAKAPAP